MLQCIAMVVNLIKKLLKLRPDFPGEMGSSLLQILQPLRIPLELLHRELLLVCGLLISEDCKQWLVNFKGVERSSSFHYILGRGRS